jgi:hypothetical protein
MSSTVRPPDRPPVGPPGPDEDHYRLAAEEARAQADSLRHAVCRANDLVRQLEEMVESLRAILLYPKAYDWPPVEPGPATQVPEGVVEGADLDEPAHRPS